MSKMNTVEELAPLIEEHDGHLDILMLGFEVDQRSHKLYTMFADMCCKPIPLASIPTPQLLDWGTAKLAGPFLLHVQFADGQGAYEIPTNEIRALVDKNLVMKETRHSSQHKDQVHRRLREKREEQGLTQDQLAEAAGIKRVTVNRIENGNQVAKLETLEKLAIALGIDVVDLLVEF